MKKHFALYILLAAMVSMNLASCNKDDDKNSSSTITDYSVYSSATTLVSSFALKANAKVAPNLDSVKFTIDQERAVIYNADSLPHGTMVAALLADVRCASTVASRQFIIKNGIKMRDTTITYTGATTDSIDFTGDVTLRITSRDGNHTRDYKVNVNVHRENPDTIVWNEDRRRDLPGTGGGAVMATKTVQQEENLLCLVHAGTGYVLSECSDPATGNWVEKSLSLPFEPQVPSFTATGDALYMLDINNQLYTSSDKGGTWSPCGVEWVSIIGAYGNRVLGVKHDGEEWKHDEYPHTSGFESTTLPATFPVAGMSQLVMASNGWSSNQQVMIMGGVTRDGTLTNQVWGYDGHQWGVISTTGSGNALPKLRNATLLSYYTYLTASDAYTPKRYDTWMVMGGVLEDGTLNTVTYTSRNQGINWSKGVSSVQMPKYMPAFCGAQAFISMQIFHASGSRLMGYNPGHITPITEWECPYIYLFGGYDVNGQPLTSVWEGVLNRLTFKPVF